MVSGFRAILLLSSIHLSHVSTNKLSVKARCHPASWNRRWPIKLRLYLKKQNFIPLYPVFGTIIIFRGHRRKHDSAVLNHMFFSFGWSCGYPCSAPTFPNSIAPSASAVPLQNHADLGRGKFLYRQGPTYDSVIYSDSAGSHRTQFEQLGAVNPVS